MAELKHIVCLANSRKHQGRCIAGIELIDGRPVQWVRPIGTRIRSEIFDEERRYADGSDPKLLDIVEIAVREPAGERPQVENWCVDPTRPWRRVGRLHWEYLAHLALPAEPLWLTDDRSTHSGKLDRVSESAARSMLRSLRLIQVERITFKILRPGHDFGNGQPRIQGSFRYLGHDYALWLTDPVMESEVFQRREPLCSYGPAYLTISLAESWRGYCHKVVAAVIEPARLARQWAA